VQWLFRRSDELAPAAIRCWGVAFANRLPATLRAMEHDPTPLTGFINRIALSELTLFLCPAGHGAVLGSSDIIVRRWISHRTAAHMGARCGQREDRCSGAGPGEWRQAVSLRACGHFAYLHDKTRARPWSGVSPMSSPQNGRLLTVGRIARCTSANLQSTGPKFVKPRFQILAGELLVARRLSWFRGMSGGTAMQLSDPLVAINRCGSPSASSSMKTMVARDDQQRSGSAMVGNQLFDHFVRFVTSRREADQDAMFFSDTRQSGRSVPCVEYDGRSLALTLIQHVAEPIEQRFARCFQGRATHTAKHAAGVQQIVSVNQYPLGPCHVSTILLVLPHRLSFAASALIITPSAAMPQCPAGRVGLDG